MAIKGAILGDILGSQYEFDRPDNLDWKNIPLCIPEKAGFTDDSVMMLAIQKALDEKLDLTETMVEIGRHYPDCGFGGNFYSWIMNDDHRPYNSWGNGSAMRVAYVADYFNSLLDVQEWAAKTAEVSHNHPEGIKGAVVTATCIWMAKNGRSKQDIYDYVLDEYPADQYPYSIDHDLKYLRKHYKWTEKCSDTVAPAMRCFYESTDYELFMRNIYSFKCDSDTFGAIAGGVAEEFYQGFGDIDAEGVLKQFLDQRLYGILTGNDKG